MATLSAIHITEHVAQINYCLNFTHICVDFSESKKTTKSKARGLDRQWNVTGLCNLTSFLSTIDKSCFLPIFRVFLS